jgi:hypothetical protein
MVAECSPEDVRALGDELTRRPEAAALRAGVSRLYYANHLFAVATVAPKLGIRVKGQGDDHGTIVHKLKNGKTMGVGILLDKLRTYREHADYHINDAHKRSDCPFCMGKLKLDSALAKTIREEAQTCFRMLGSI